MGDLRNWKPENGKLPQTPVEWHEYEVIMGEDKAPRGTRGGGYTSGRGSLPKGALFFIIFFVLLFIVELFGALH